MEIGNIKKVTSPVSQDPFQKLGWLTILSLRWMSRIAVQEQSAHQHLGGRIYRFDRRVGHLQHLGIISSPVIFIVLIPPTSKTTVLISQSIVDIRFIAQLPVFDIVRGIAISLHERLQELSKFI